MEGKPQTPTRGAPKHEVEFGVTLGLSSALNSGAGHGTPRLPQPARKHSFRPPLSSREEVGRVVLGWSPVATRFCGESKKSCYQEYNHPLEARTLSLKTEVLVKIKNKGKRDR